MKYDDFLNFVGHEPVFTSAIFRVLNIPTERIQQQLVRWVKTGRVIQLRRGVYTLAEPYRRVDPHPFLIANRLKKASYISLQSALAYHGMIPEYVPVVTSVTTGRPEYLQTKLGGFLFKHIKKLLFKDYLAVEVTSSQFAFVATPEKAFLDLVYLTPKSDTDAYLKELRLENLDKINRLLLMEIARSSGSPKLIRSAQRFIRLAEAERYEEL